MGFIVGALNGLAVSIQNAIFKKLKGAEFCEDVSTFAAIARRASCKLPVRKYRMTVWKS